MSALSLASHPGPAAAVPDVAQAVKRRPPIHGHLGCYIGEHESCHWRPCECGCHLVEPWPFPTSDDATGVG